MSRPGLAQAARPALCAVAAALCFCAAVALAQSAPPTQQRTPLGSRRVPEKRPFASAALMGLVQTTEGVPVPGAEVELIPARGRSLQLNATAEGIFRAGQLTPGKYKVKFSGSGVESMTQNDVMLNAGELLTIEVKLMPSAMAKLPPARETPQPPGNAPAPEQPSYREISRQPEVVTQQPAPPLPPDSKIFVASPDRWDPDMPDWQRNPGRTGDFPWGADSHWYDPFHVNRYKADKPIFGQNTFFNFNGTSTTAADIRNLFVPSGVSAQHPGSFTFFGQGGQVFFSQIVRLSFTLFHGDTSFKPVDWQVRITPAIDLNQLWAQERGVVNIDVREGTSRFDSHVGLQEAFVEKKLADLGPDYDFISVRAGIQQFQSDFRGLIFTEEQPGVRVFGNLDNNKIQYNAAYFWFMEKDTNSGLNKFANRHQQVLVANLYRQDFIWPGYTIQASYHYDKDDATIHYDENGFLVRPAPIGAVQPHDIRAHYIGITGEGHIKRINISHAFYQALGDDDLNPVAGRRTEINAQLGFLELSLDKDWIRFRGSALFASGDSNPRDGEARGFDSIVDSDALAGGIFSFFNREGIRLTQTGVALVSPDSFLPDLRSSKNEGQASFVNPGLFLFNGGMDVDVTTKMRVVADVNYMRFHHTAPLDLLLFQQNIKDELGTDYSLGMVYRPRLSDNIIITGGAAALTPGQGLRQIYTNKTLLSLFTEVKFRF